MIDQFTLSGFSLKISDETTQANYVKYHRKEIHERVQYVLFVAVFASTCKTVLQLTMIGRNNELSAEDLYATLAMVLPSLCLSFSYCLGSKNLKFAELHGPALFGSLTLLTVVFNVIYQEVQSTSLLYSQQTFAFLYLIAYVGLLNATYHTNFVIRMILYAAIRFSSGYENVKKLDTDPFLILAMNVLGWMAVEIIFHVQYRAQVILYLMMDSAAFQQRQLHDLLDSVPGKVLICTQAKEDTKTKPIYSNREVKKFFGCDPTIYKERSWTMTEKIFQSKGDFSTIESRRRLSES